MATIWLERRAHRRPWIPDQVRDDEGEGGGAPAAGLGLPLTRQFVEAHGGTLTLASEPGQGTTLIIRLPRAG